MSLVNINNPGGKVISNNSSSSSISSSTSTSTTKKSGGSATNSLKKKEALAQESISSSEVHFEEEDTLLTPPAISFTTLITDYETELMAFIDNETSRTPSPQPQPDLLIDIQHDEHDGQQQPLQLNQLPGTGEQQNGVGLLKSRNSNSHSHAKVEALIDESAKMVINNKNLLLHDLELQTVDDVDDELMMNDYQEHDNSLTSTTTLDTVIAVGDLASSSVNTSVGAGLESGSGGSGSGSSSDGGRHDHNNEFNSLEQEDDERGNDNNEHEHEHDNDDNNHPSNGHHYFGVGEREREQESCVDDSLVDVHGGMDESNTALGDNENDNKFHQKQEESVIIKSSSSSSKKSTSSTSSSSSNMVKQTSIEKAQQQGKQVKETIKQSGVTAQESIKMNMTNGGPANVEASASVNQTKEFTKINDEGVVKQKKKNSNQSISVSDEDDELDEPSDCATNNNNAKAMNVNVEPDHNRNGFHSQYINNICNNNKNASGSADQTRNMNERNRNSGKDQSPAPAPAPSHELDDNEVFNFVSVSKLKSSFTKFDNLARADSDTSVKQIQGKRQPSVGSPQQESPLDKKPNEHTCKCCGKPIFIMELIRAEKEDWHKSCFRCSVCKKNIGVDNYCSNEGILYCKPHFKELFQPKPVLDPNANTPEEDEETRRKKRAEIIIRESEPVQLPPDVVKSTVDDTSQRFAELEELNKNLDVKSKFQVFQTLAVGQDQEQQPIEPVKRSSSAVLQSRVAKYQSAVEAAKMESATSAGAVGVSDADLGHIPPGGIEEGNGNEDSDDDAATIKLMTKKLIPADEINFDAVDSVRSKWEQNGFAANARREEARKEESARFRSKLLHGKSNQLKEMYEKSVVECTTSPTSSTSPNLAQLVDENGEVVNVAKARELKEKFESVRDDVANPNKAAMLQDEIFESEITKTSRNLFKELDKSASTVNFQQNAMAKSESKTAVSRQQHSFEGKDVVRSSDVMEEVIAPADISNKFQFFEKYTDQQQKAKEKKQFRFTPPREGQVKEPSPDVEIYRDPNVVRACDNQVDAPPKTNTASKMLSVFRELEAAEKQQTQHNAYKPLKEFTPPRETRPPFANGNGNGHGAADEYDDDSDEEQVQLNNSHGSTVEKDEILKQMGSLARASSLRAKFEVWNDNNQENGDSDEEVHEHEHQNGNAEVIAPSIDTTKNLRAKFEKIKDLEELALNNKKEAFNKRPVKRFV